MFRRQHATRRPSDARSESSPLEIRCACERGRYVIAPAGDIDLVNAWRLEQELVRAEASGADEILLDLGGVRFIDSIGMKPVIHATARARERGKRLLIVPGPANVQRSFETTGLVSRLPFVDREGQVD